jgi:hypothetical protein
MMTSTSGGGNKIPQGQSALSMTNGGNSDQYFALAQMI